MDRVEEPVVLEAPIAALLEFYDEFGHYERVWAGDRIAAVARDARVRGEHDQADRMYALARDVVSGRHLGRLTRKNTG